MKYVLVTGAYGGMGKATIKLLKETFNNIYNFNTINNNQATKRNLQ